MGRNAERTTGKTPAMAFVLDYLREFPGAGYDRVARAAQAHGLAAPPTIVYGNALRVLKKEAARQAAPAEAVPPAGRRRARRGGALGVQDLASLIDQMEAVVAERDRLRRAIDGIRVAIKSIR